MAARTSICTACRAGLRNAFQLQLQQQQQKRWHSTSSKPSTPETEKPYKLIPFNSLQPTDLAYYWDTTPPSASNLAYADKFFAPSRHSPVKLFSAAQFRTMPFDSKEPEVAFLGRSNVGKSSIINALIGEELCYVSKRPGKTTEMNAFGLGGKKGGESKIVLLDMPGYGKASRTEWGIEIMKYLKQRKQLRRTYLLIDSLHGIKDNDREILALLRRYGISHQIILSKVDRVLADKLRALKEFQKVRFSVRVSRIRQLQKMMEKMRPILQPGSSSGGDGGGSVEGPGALGEILTCASEAKVAKGDKNCLGISNIRWSILKATGLDGSIEAEAFKDSIPVESVQDEPVPPIRFIRR